MMQRRLVWAGVVAVVVAVPALMAPGYVYDPAPLLESLAASVRPVAPGSVGGPGSVLVIGVRLPGASAPTSIRIENGRIAAIGDVDGADLPVLDGGGRYAIPGLFDAHVHLTLAPGAALRADDADTSAELRAWHMRAYLACGVTSILDPAGDDRIAIEVRERLRAGHAGPRYFALGPPVAARDGYVADLFPPGFSDADAAAGRVGQHLDRLTAMEADGVKVPLEPGMLAPIWDVLGDGVLEAIHAGAAARKLPVYVHAMSEEMYARGLRLSPHAFVHPPQTLSPQMLALLAQARPYVMTTLAAFDVQRDLVHPQVFDDAQARLVIPPLEMDTLRSPAMRLRYMVAMVGENLPFVPGRYRDLLGHLALTSFGQRTAGVCRWCSEATRATGRCFRSSFTGRAPGAKSRCWSRWASVPAKCWRRPPSCRPGCSGWTRSWAASKSASAPTSCCSTPTPWQGWPGPCRRSIPSSPTAWPIPRRSGWRFVEAARPPKLRGHPRLCLAGVPSLR